MKENPGYEVQYLNDKTTALEQKQLGSTAESLKRLQPVDPLQEPEIKRIRITSLAQDTKPCPDLANSEKIQIKVMSGNLTKVVTQQVNSSSVQEVEEKRTIMFDKRPSSQKAAPLARNPSPPRSVQSSKGGQESSTLLKGQNMKIQITADAGRSTGFSKPRERIGYSIWDSPDKQDTEKPLDKQSSDRFAPKFGTKGFVDHKATSRSDAMMQNRAESAASSSEALGIRLQFKGKGISMGQGQQSGVSAGKEAPAQSAAGNFKSPQSGTAVKGICWPLF